MNNLRVLELFGGIGAPRKALTNLCIPFVIVDYVEYDPKPVEVYNNLYGENFEPQDVRNWDKDIDIDLIVHGSPCQDFSMAGKGAGGEQGSGTRSSLIYETIRIVKKTMPKYIIWENVKNVMSDKHVHVANDYFNQLSSLGYKTTWKVTKGQYYGVPQARERVIAISVLNGEEFIFPEETNIANNLEDYVDFRKEDDLTFNFFRRYKEVIDKNASESDFESYIESLPTLKGIGTKKMGLYNFGEMDTITTCTNMTGTLTCRNVQNYNKKYLYKGRLYKPSPKMCFNLMGFSNEDYEKVKHLPDKQLYNAAGNSIIVNVLQEIFKKLLVLSNE